MPSAVILAFVNNPDDSPRLKKFTTEAVKDGALLICADSAGEAALAWELTPDFLVGDMDSITPAALKTLSEMPGVQVKAVKPEKDETDLELAIYFALDFGATEITICGGVGGRLDHTLANLYLLAMPRLMTPQVRSRILSEQEEIILLRPELSPLELKGTGGQLVSLFPFKGDVDGIYTQKLYYPLNNETLYFGPSRGISNVMLDIDAIIEIKSGLLLIIHYFGSSELR
jgi:thiamine pyrophosphokinase